MDANVLKHRLAVSMDGGMSLGSVEDVLFDTAQLRIAALVIRRDGAKSILPFESVQHIGAQELIVTSVHLADTERATGGTNLMRSLGDIIGLRVLNGEAEYLGDVRSVTIDDLTGDLTELGVQSGGVLGFGGSRTIIPASVIRGIGDDFVTAEMSAMGTQ